MALAAAPPNNIIKWVNEQHTRPAVDQDWLRDCCSWIASSYSLSPTSKSDFPQFSTQITSQFFQSSLTDSTLPNTGLPVNIHTVKRARLAGPPCLVEIRAISDIAHSAFSLMNLRQNRMDRADLAGLVADAQDGAEDDGGPIQKYPRGMLRLELSDGFTTVEAVEYRSIPELELGVTPLGYKILLKDVQIRRGIFFLEPKTIELKGHQTEDHELMQDEIFLRSLSRRLGKPDINTGPQPTGLAAPHPAPPSIRIPSSSASERLSVGNPPHSSTPANAASSAVRSKPASSAAPKPRSATGASNHNSNPASSSSAHASSSKLTASLKPPVTNNSVLMTSPYFSSSSTSSSTNPSTSRSGMPDLQDNPSAPLAQARILSPAPRDSMWNLDDEEFEALLTESGAAPISPPKPILKLSSTRNGSSAKPVASEALRPPSPPSDYDLDLMDLDMDEEILAQVDKMEAEALANVSKTTGAKSSSSNMCLDVNASRASGGSSAHYQASSSALRMTPGSSRLPTMPTIRPTTSPRSLRADPAFTQRQPQNSIPRLAGSGTRSPQHMGPGPTATHCQYPHTQHTLHEDVIVVDSEDDMYVDDSDEGKENVPISAQTRVVVCEDEEVIDISD